MAPFFLSSLIQLERRSNFKTYWKCKPGFRAESCCCTFGMSRHILSGCQHTQIRNVITERHNIACRMILKAIRNTGSLGSCVVSKDIGSNERMTMQNLQIPGTAESRIVPKWLFPPRFPDKDRLTSPVAQVLCCYSHRCKNTKTTN
jgi:hypothetical protein